MPPEAESTERYVFDACALIAYLNDEVSSDHHEFDQIAADEKARFFWIR